MDQIKEKARMAAICSCMESPISASRSEHSEMASSFSGSRASPSACTSTLQVVGRKKERRMRGHYTRQH